MMSTAEILILGNDRLVPGAEVNPGILTAAIGKADLQISSLNSR